MREILHDKDSVRTDRISEISSDINKLCAIGCLKFRRHTSC